MPSSATGGVPHADVAFNPWYPWQFATIDQSGAWRVWETGFHGEHNPSTRLSQIAFGKLPESDVLSNAQQSRDAGGWSKIAWAGDLFTLAVCNRDRLEVVAISEEPKPALAPVLESGNKHGVIADVKLDPLHPERMFVLTTMDIFYLKVSSHIDTEASMHNTATTEILLKIRHFRDVADTSLHLLVFADGDGTFAFR